MPTSTAAAHSSAPEGAGDIEIRGLDKIYAASSGPIQALDGVDLTIEAGSFISLVGPSGCGKSTLLKLIAGLIEPSAGTIHHHGVPVSGPSRQRGLMFQTSVLFPWRTVLENVLLPTETSRARDTDGDQERAIEVLDMAGLANFQDAYPRELSGGMQQRVALCRLLVYDPPVLLMDEPFGALDEFTRERLNLELLDLWSRTRKTVVFVTHSIAEAVLLSERIAVMGTRPGHLIETIDVPLEHPRSPETVVSEGFTRTLALVRSLLADQQLSE